MFPPGGSAKNGADIRLCLDAMEDMGRFAHIGTVIIVGGDSDFMPVSQKVKAAGRNLVGIGTRGSTNRHWAKSCHEFRYYDNLVDMPPEPDVSPALSVTLQNLHADTAAEIFTRAVRLLAQAQGDAWVTPQAIWQMIRRLDSTFDPKEHGYANFPGMLLAFDGLLETRNDGAASLIRLR